VEELDKIHTIVAEVKKELTADKIPFKDDVEEGVMIETPAAALISDDLAHEGGFLQHRHQRPDAVHTGNGQAEQSARCVL
jgi:hypothetical protein